MPSFIINLPVNLVLNILLTQAQYGHYLVFFKIQSITDFQIKTISLTQQSVFIMYVQYRFLTKYPTLEWCGINDQIKTVKLYRLTLF